MGRARLQGSHPLVVGAHMGLEVSLGLQLLDGSHQGVYHLLKAPYAAMGVRQLGLQTGAAARLQGATQRKGGSIARSVTCTWLSGCL